MKPTAPAEQSLLDVDRLAEWLGTTPRHVRALVADRRVPFVKVGRLVRFERHEIASWLDEHRRPVEQGVDDAA